jgi:hypothetical protein
LLALACFVVFSTCFTATASTAAPSKPKPGDGLPRQWIGVAGFEAVVGGITLRAHAEVTFTLAEKNPRGYEYQIGKGSKIHIEEFGTTAGGCSLKADVVKPLEAGEGALTIIVTRRPRKPVKAEYGVGGGNAGTLTTFPETQTCPEGGTGTGDAPIMWLNSGPLRRMRLTATMLQGTYRGNDVRTDEWCFVRKRPDVLKCDLGIGPDA